MNSQSLFPFDINDKIIPESLTKEHFGIVSDWIVMEYFDTPEMDVSIEHYKGNLDIELESDRDIPSDINFIVREKINEEYIRDNMNLENLISVNIKGNIVGRSVSSDYRELDRHYFVVRDIKVNGHWFSYNNIEKFCDDFDLTIIPCLGIYNFDAQKAITHYQGYGITEFIKYLEEQLLDKVVDFDVNHGIQSMSKFGENKGCYFPSDGVLARSRPQLYDDNCNRIQFFLDISDVKRLYKRSNKRGK